MPRQIPCDVLCPDAKSPAGGNCFVGIRPFSPAMQYDVRPRLGKGDGNRTANTLGGAGDEGRVAAKVDHEQFDPNLPLERSEQATLFLFEWERVVGD